LATDFADSGIIALLPVEAHRRQCMAAQTD